MDVKLILDISFMFEERKNFNLTNDISYLLTLRLFDFYKHFDLVLLGDMKHLAAYLLLELAGKTPNDKSIKSLLNTVGIETDDTRLKQLIKELDGKSADEVLIV